MSTTQNVVILNLFSCYSIMHFNLILISSSSLFVSEISKVVVTMIDTDLEAFARKQINAETYPDDVHICNQFRCKQCAEVVPFSLCISYSRACDDARPAQDFAGTVHSTCSKCGSKGIVLSIKRGAFPEEEQETPRCSCGSDSFYLCMCERYEGANGLEGFFDEGVIVGKCSRCGALKTFLFTD